MSTKVTDKNYGFDTTLQQHESMHGMTYLKGIFAGSPLIWSPLSTRFHKAFTKLNVRTGQVPSDRKVKEHLAQQAAGLWNFPRDPLVDIAVRRWYRKDIAAEEQPDWVVGRPKRRVKMTPEQARALVDALCYHYDLQISDYKDCCTWFNEEYQRTGLYQVLRHPVLETMWREDYC